MFYAHSSLLERAGKLLKSDKTLTSLPVILTPNDDITAYLSTNIMSITDGQIIFDLGVFRQGIRPAVNAGLSVSRVGGQAQNKRQKDLTQELFKRIAKYHQAESFSHFGSSLSAEAGIDLQLGKQIYAVLHQPPQERYTLAEQELMLGTVLMGQGRGEIDVEGMKKSVKEAASQIKNDDDYQRLKAELYKKHAIQPAVAKAAPPPPAPPAPDKKADKKAEKKEKHHAKS
jgi:F-type H+-transporting ATPase subunit alpha